MILVQNGTRKRDPVWLLQVGWQPGDRIAVMSKVGIENPVAGCAGKWLQG